VREHEKSPCFDIPKQFVSFIVDKVKKHLVFLEISSSCEQRMHTTFAIEI
jgi:hypothetical protein